ncbi:hypothetical protein GCM10010441_43320 [Kitasatospora paracochleata]|uniref:Uncharacterized protein n=1 Tax=Kitasatospora paracochleata TaxID=58354 RepID=A0ABT1J0E0_9ACTN|nr:hypothetical protein [Kitasatospora paracochleata]MCP2310884.1 hypothetical protein [Kitasatospora paracochleata]
MAALAPIGSPCRGRTGSGYLCLFSGVNYTGSEIDVRQCSSSPLATYIRTGTPIGIGTPFAFLSTMSDLKDPDADWTTIPC